MLRQPNADFVLQTDPSGSHSRSLTLIASNINLRTTTGNSRQCEEEGRPDGEAV